MLDRFVWGEVRRISPEAPVPVVEVVREDSALGGAGNVALNISALGGRVTLTAAVGQDESGREISALLDNAGIGRSLFVRDVPTITKTRLIARTQQLVRIDREQKKPLSRPHGEQLAGILEGMRHFDGIIISDYGKGFITPAVIAALRAFTQKYGRILTVDPKIEHFGYYRQVTCLTPNKLEASAGLRVREPETPAELTDLGKRIMARLRCRNLLITLGKEGMLLLDGKGGISHIPTVAQEVFDVTGAGDTVIATLTLALAAGADITEASIIANFAAGIVVGKLGTAVATRDELREFYGKNAAAAFVEAISTA